MSTAGKVLTVLVALVAVVWIVLTAAVAQLNRNGAKALEDVRASIVKLEAEVKTADETLQKIKDEWNHDQYLTQMKLTELDARQSNVQKAWSEQKETLARVTIQLADAEATQTSADENKARRLADKQAEQKALELVQADVETRKADRTERVNELTELRDKFKAKLDENRSLVQQLQKKTGTPTTRANRTIRPLSIENLRHN